MADAAVSDTTRGRYFVALQRLLPLLENIHSEHGLDDAVCSFIAVSWKKGLPLYLVGDALSGLHRQEAWTKKKIPRSWRLFSTWRRLEVPARAPPLTLPIVRALAHLSLFHDDLIFATLLLLGFFGLLRTGELLKVRPCDLLVLLCFDWRTPRLPNENKASKVCRFMIQNFYFC